MKKIILVLIIISILFSGCTTTNKQEREGYPIIFEQRITEEGYYNGPLEFTKKDRDYERRKEYMDEKIKNYYNNRNS
ncbi:MAG: hypothetical protein VXZ40_05225 [Nanoarchaeota archaeon]|nr:hypothetical protein [Nanoarchaeota archaeon]